MVLGIILAIAMASISYAQEDSIPQVPAQNDFDFTDANWVNDPKADAGTIKENFDKIDDLRSINDPEKLNQAFQAKFEGKKIGDLGSLTKITAGGLLQTIDPSGAFTKTINPNDFPNGEFKISSSGDIVFKPDELKAGEQAKQMPAKGEFLIDSEGKEFSISGPNKNPYNVMIPEGMTIRMKDGNLILEPEGKVFINGYEIVNQDEVDLPIRIIGTIENKPFKDLLKTNTFEKGINFYDKGMEHGFAAVEVSNCEIISPSGAVIYNIGGKKLATFAVEYPFSKDAYVAYNPGNYNKAAEDLQKMLNELGYKDNNGNKLQEDGLFGQRTKEALTNFQKQMNKEGLLPEENIDGVLGRETSAAIAKVYGPRVTIEEGMLAFPENKVLVINNHVIEAPTTNNKQGLRLEFTENDKYFQYINTKTSSVDSIKGTKSPLIGMGMFSVRIPTLLEQSSALKTNDNAITGISQVETDFVKKEHPERMEITKEYFSDNGYFGVVGEDKISANEPIQSPYGNRVVFGKKGFHEGIDISARSGTDVMPMREGTVKFAGYGSPNNGYNDYGNIVVVDHGDGTETSYAHLSEIDVKAGDQVNTGQVVGVSGNTGKTTGPHIHVTTIVDGKKINPIDYYETYVKKGTQLASSK